MLYQADEIELTSEIEKPATGKTAQSSEEAYDTRQADPQLQGRLHPQYTNGQNMPITTADERATGDAKTGDPERACLLVAQQLSSRREPLDSLITTGQSKIIHFPSRLQERR